MPDELRARISRLIASGIVSAERLCYSLLAPIWPAIELDFLLATSSRVAAIIQGGASFEDQAARQPQLEVARAARLLGMYYKRLDGKDLAASKEASDKQDRGRVFEDASQGVEWQMLGDCGAVAFSNVPEGPLPWQGKSLAPVSATGGRVIVLPRPHPLPPDAAVVESLVRAHAAPVVVIAPLRTVVAGLDQVPVFVGPDDMAALDSQVERNLLSSRLART